MTLRIEVPLYAAKASALGATGLVYANCGPHIDTRLGPIGSADHTLAARAVSRLLRIQEHPFLHVAYCDVYFCTPQVDEVVTGVTISDLAKGIRRGCYVPDKAITAFAPYARAIREANLEDMIEGCYFDVERGPTFWNLDNPEFGGHSPNGLRAMLNPQDAMAFSREVLTAEYNACRMTLEAHGIDGRKAIVLGCTAAGQHNDNGDLEIPAIPGVVRSCLDFTLGTPMQLARMDAELEANGAATAYVILSAINGPAMLKAQLDKCRRHNVPDVTIFPNSPAIAQGDTDAQVIAKTNAQLDALAAAGVR